MTGIVMSPDSTPAQAERCAILLAAVARRGDGDAACLLGDGFREGKNGVRYSPRQAFHWYAHSALAGDPTGQSNLGVCYEAGFGCGQDDGRAFKWYRRAAAQKSPVGTFNLGLCYLMGRGVPADRAEALARFRNALSLGWEPAREKLVELGAGPERNTEKESV